MIDASGVIKNHYDPNRFEIRHDPLAVVGAQFNLDEYKIKFKLAKQFKNDTFTNVAQYIKVIRAQIKPNIIGIETNNRGKEIYNLFRHRYQMPWLHPVHTSSNLTEKTRQKGYAMDKPDMVSWFKQMMKKQMFEFPTTPTKDMQELIDQIPKITAYPTLSGQTAYRAHKGQHDDLFMAALLCCNIIRLFIEEQERLK